MDKTRSTELIRMNCCPLMPHCGKMFRQTMPRSLAPPESAWGREVFKRSAKSVEGMTESLEFLERRCRQSRAAAAAEQ